MLYTELKDKKKGDAALKKLVHQTTQQLEKFPRKNRHSQEWFEKYHQKYLELKSKSEYCDQTVDSISSLFQEVEQQKQKALERDIQESQLGLRGDIQANCVSELRFSEAGKGK